MIRNKEMDHDHEYNRLQSGLDEHGDLYRNELLMQNSTSCAQRGVCSSYMTTAAHYLGSEQGYTAWGTWLYVHEVHC